MRINIGINASRARSGGAISHLVGILRELVPAVFNIGRIHVWSYERLITALPNKPWLEKHCPDVLNMPLYQQLLWEFFYLPVELRKKSCQVLLNVDAGSDCRFGSSVTISQDMLSYEPGEIDRYGLSLSRLRLIALRYIQNSSLRSADGSIFLTYHASKVIQQSCGVLKNIAHVPHGIGAEFFVNHCRKPEDQTLGRCLYVSNALPYKHQWHVVDAVSNLRDQGYDLQLELVGGGEGVAQKRLDAKIKQRDPKHLFVTQRDFVPQHTLPQILSHADLFIFASSCENMPNTLIEAMAAGLPIACSDRGPMPEVLQDGGVYFDPERPESIAQAIADLLDHPEKRERLARRARELASQYSWKRCAEETFSFLVESALKSKALGRKFD